MQHEQSKLHVRWSRVWPSVLIKKFDAPAVLDREFCEAECVDAAWVADPYDSVIAQHGPQRTQQRFITCNIVKHIAGKNEFKLIRRRLLPVEHHTGNVRKAIQRRIGNRKSHSRRRMVRKSDIMSRDQSGDSDDPNNLPQRNPPVGQQQREHPEWDKREVFHSEREPRRNAR